MYYVVLLDISESFDGVNYMYLFNELKTNSLCPLADLGSIPELIWI